MMNLNTNTPTPNETITLMQKSEIFNSIKTIKDFLNFFEEYPVNREASTINLLPKNMVFNLTITDYLNYTINMDDTNNITFSRIYKKLSSLFPEFRITNNQGSHKKLVVLKYMDSFLIIYINFLELYMSSSFPSLLIDVIEVPSNTTYDSLGINNIKKEYRRYTNSQKLEDNTYNKIPNNRITNFINNIFEKEVSRFISRYFGGKMLYTQKSSKFTDISVICE
jgi:hypothetical protein